MAAKINEIIHKIATKCHITNMLLVICVSIPYQIIIDVYGNGTKLNMFV
jgi:hypothetical protein